MKIVSQSEKTFVLRIDKGEEVMEQLLKFVKDNNITASSFFGIGAAETLELGFLNPHIKDYRKKQILDETEIVSLSGNTSMVNGEPALHAHGAFSKNDFSTIGGHVFKIFVSVTCEIVLTKLDLELKREMNPDFNLNLLN